MSKVKLELQSKTDPELRALATKHEAAMLANPNFLTPTPDAMNFGATAGNFASKLDAISAMQTALKKLYAEKDMLRPELEGSLSIRGSYVDTASGGDEAKILSSGFDVQSAATPTTSMPAPERAVATIGDDAGEVDLGCDAVPKAKSYICEYREQSETAAPGPWTVGKVFSRSSGTISGLVSGRKYAFRMRALGPNDLESPWSDEAVCMAA